MHGLEGTRLGRYLLQNRLGRGGMSEVYLAIDERMHRDVAVKVVSSAHSDYVERFQREAEAIGRLQHDHILPAYDFGEQLPWYYLVMPYIDYCTLLDKIKDGPLPLDYAGELLTQIASGLQYAHDHGVIHRDIKPSNILLRDDHFIYLADFGLARSVEGADKVTQTGILLGTPEYMAPELADGPAGKSSDIYALGILLYQMVTGRMPFTGDTPLSVYLKQMRESPISPSRINPAIPHAVDTVILRALEKDPRRRFSSPMALAETYNQALQTARRASQIPPAQHPTPSIFETTPIGEELLHQEANIPVLPVSPSPMLEPLEPLPEPVAPVVLPDKLVLPAYTPTYPQAPARAPGSRPPASPVSPAPPAPNYRTASPPQGPARRRVPARRGPDLNMILIFILILMIIGAAVTFIVVASAANGNKSPTSSQLTQTAAAAQGSPSPSLSPSSQPTATATPNATLTAQASIYGTATAVTGLTPLLSDNLSSNTGNRWPDDGKTCTFSNGTYHVLVSQASYLQPCSPANFTCGNCAIKVDVSLLQGNDAGFILRMNGDQFYDFEITDQRQYFFRRHDANAGANYVQLVPNTGSNSIHSGATNTLMVIANGSNFLLFINGTFVNQVHDSTYGSGQISLVAGTFESASSADASFANLNVYPTQ
jgi:serine/threonine protein kinase